LSSLSLSSSSIDITSDCRTRVSAGSAGARGDTAAAAGDDTVRASDEGGGGDVGRYTQHAKVR
jgi:hypothetical protein